MTMTCQHAVFDQEGLYLMYRRAAHDSMYLAVSETYTIMHVMWRSDSNKSIRALVDLLKEGNALLLLEITRAV